MKMLKASIKLRFLLRTCRIVFSNINHHTGISDKSMIKFKGRYKLKQFIRDKPTSWGFKAFLLCSAHDRYEIPLRDKTFTQQLSQIIY